MGSSFSQVFSSLRRERGLSQRKAAADLGISQALLSHYENGVREPRLDFVVKACEYYGVSADHILGRTTIKANHLSIGDAELNSVIEKSAYKGIGKAVGVLVGALYRTAGAETSETACRLYALITYRMLVQMGVLDAGESAIYTDMLLSSEIGECVHRLLPAIMAADTSILPEEVAGQLAVFEKSIKNTLPASEGMKTNDR